MYFETFFNIDFNILSKFKHIKQGEANKSSECNHSGHSDGGGSRSGKAEGGVAIFVDDLVIVVVVVGDDYVIVVVFVINTKWIVRIAGLLLIVVRLLTVFVTLLTLFVSLLVGFTVLIFSLTLSIVVRLLFLFL